MSVYALVAARGPVCVGQRGALETRCKLKPEHMWESRCRGRRSVDISTVGDNQDIRHVEARGDTSTYDIDTLLSQGSAEAWVAFLLVRGFPRRGRAFHFHKDGGRWWR